VEPKTRFRLLFKRDALEAFTTAVEAGEVTEFKASAYTLHAESNQTSQLRSLSIKSSTTLPGKRRAYVLSLAKKETFQIQHPHDVLASMFECACLDLLDGLGMVSASC
jgi:hypothetical protein